MRSLVQRVAFAFFSVAPRRMSAVALCALVTSGCSGSSAGEAPRQTADSGTVTPGPGSDSGATPGRGADSAAPGHGTDSGVRTVDGGSPPSADTGATGEGDIAMLVYPGFTVLDLAAPHTAFVLMGGAKVHLVWKDLSPVTADSGITVKPTTTFADTPLDLDILFVPGALLGSAVLKDQEVLSFLRSRGERAKLVTSVCTGSLVLGAAGLLKGYRATSHWAARDLLSLLGAEPVNARYVEDRNRITGAGVTAGLDFSLRLVARLKGQERAEMVQLMLEYAPEPPFNAGSPETAPPPVKDALDTFLEPFIQPAREAVTEIGKTL